MKKLLFFFIVFLSSVTFALAQKTVTGVVNDASGDPIIGANVLVQGASVGTVTDLDGKFSIDVPAGKNFLIISYIGFTDQVVDITSTSKVTVGLAEGKLLDEIVVTGTGVAVSRRTTAFDVQSIGTNKLPIAPTADVGSALVGKIAGAQISSVNGSPGQPVNIILRGINSVRGGTNPMIVMDGIQIASTGLENLDLNNIERIEVVSGPASATLYGAQGANGVIQLFSKKGKKGKLNIDFSSNTAVNELLNVGNVNKAKKHPYQTDANNNVVSASGKPLAFDPVTGSYIDNPVFNLISPTSVYNKSYDGGNLQWYDHYKMFFGKAKTFNNSLAVNGGADKFDFSFVLSDSKQETVFKNNGDFRRTNVTANVGFEVLKGLKVRSLTQIVNTQSTLLDPTGRNMLYPINNSRPFANYLAKDEQGLASPYFGDAVGVNAYNFNFVVENSKVKDNTIALIQYFNVNYKLNKYVELDTKYGLNRNTRNDRFEIKDQTASQGAEFWQYWAEFYSPRTSFGAPTTGSESGEINQTEEVSQNQNFNANAFFTFDLKKDFNINLPISSSTQVGWDYRATNYSYYRTYGLDAPDFTPYRANNMATFRINDDYTEKFVTYGTLVNQRFMYDDIAGVSAGFRSDYSSAFGQGSTPFTFPRGDAFVRLSKFNFFENSKISKKLNEIKLRVAYGEAGIQPGAYDRFPILSTTSLGTQSGFSTPVSNANPLLEIEVSKELEYGFDLGFKLSNGAWLNNANFSFTNWTRKSENVIDRVDVAPSTGVGLQLTNSLNLKSNGIQASLNLIVLTNKNWEWDFTTNFNKQISKIDKVKFDAEIIKTSAAGSTQYVLRAGEQIGQIYGYIFPNSLDQLGPDGKPLLAEAERGAYEVASNGYVVNKTTKQPYASADRFALGDPNPDFNMSFINQITFKKMITFGMQWDWVQGSQLYNQTKQWMYRDGIHNDYDKEITIDGKTEAYSAFYRGAYAVRQANGTKSYFMEDASFLRLRNLSIGTELTKIFKMPAISSCQLTLSGRNIFTATKYTGYDPEVSSGTGSSSWDRSVDHNTIPNLKTYQVGIKISY